MNLTPNVPPAPASRAVPLPPEPPSARRSRLFYLGLSGLIVGGIICLLSAVALILYFVLSHKTAPPESALPVSLPTTSNLPAATNAPSADNLLPPPTATSPGVAAFNDDFSNCSIGWTVVSTQASEASNNSLGFNELGEKQANSYSVSLAPDNFSKPVKNFLISVRAQQPTPLFLWERGESWM